MFREYFDYTHVTLYFLGLLLSGIPLYANALLLRWLTRSTWRGAWRSAVVILVETFAIGLLMLSSYCNNGSYTHHPAFFMLLFLTYAFTLLMYLDYRKTKQWRGSPLTTLTFMMLVYLIFL